MNRNTKMSVCGTAAGAALLLGLTCVPSFGISDAPPDLRTDLIAIADQIREIGTTLENPALMSLSEHMLDSATRLSQEDLSSLPELAEPTAHARDQLEQLAGQLAAGKQRKFLTRFSAGYPEVPDGNPLYSSPCTTTASLAAETSASVAEGILGIARFKCLQQVPGAPNPSFICVPIS